MTIREKIIELFKTTTGSYKGVPINCFGLPSFSSFNKNSVRNVFYKLEKDGFLYKKNTKWYINKDKEIKLKTKNIFKSPFKDNSPKNLLLMFDIPEKERCHRSWIRRQLQAYGYILFQKSVWIGPSPLPKEFIKYMESINIWENIKTFKLARPVQIKKEK